MADTAKKELDIRKTKLKQAGIASAPKAPEVTVPSEKEPFKSPVDKAVEEIRAKRQNPDKGDLDKRFADITKGMPKRY